MTRIHACLSAALALGLAWSAAPAVAADAPPRGASKPAAKKNPKPAAVAAPAPLALASDEQKAAASLAHLGEYACDFGQSVTVANNPLAPGYIDVAHKGQTWVMRPLLSSTGALRLEDVKSRMLMIQIANKSMLMDTQLGQRLVDGCQHEKQREFARTLNPADSTGSLLK